MTFKLRQLGWMCSILMMGTLPATAQTNPQTNRLNIRMANDSMLNNLYDKTPFTGVSAQLNGGPDLGADAHIRGRSCSLIRRKCLGLKIDKKKNKNVAKENLRLHFNGTSGLEGKSFNLVSMGQDAGYISSKLGIEMFKAIKFYNLKSEYSEVLINDYSYGLYLITEKPKNAIADFAPNAFIGRRGYDATLETEELPEEAAEGSNSSVITEQEALDSFKSLYADLDRNQGAALETRIRKNLDLDQYMTWILVNSLLLNGDFADEIFMYAEKNKSGQVYWQVFPWDFDDLFKPAYDAPENKTRAADIRDGLLYNFQNPLDAKIYDDAVLRQKLKAHALKLFTQTITPQLVNNVFAKIESEIRPYLDIPEVLKRGQLDPASGKKPYTKDGILKILAERKATVLQRLEVLKSRAK